MEKLNNIENELIEYLLEIVGDDDRVCVELHQYPKEQKYCEQFCQNLNQNCIRRLINNRKVDRKVTES